MDESEVNLGARLDENLYLKICSGARPEAKSLLSFHSVPSASLASTQTLPLAQYHLRLARRDVAVAVRVFALRFAFCARALAVLGLSRGLLCRQTQSNRIRRSLFESHIRRFRNYIIILLQDLCHRLNEFNFRVVIVCGRLVGRVSAAHKEVNRMLNKSMLPFVQKSVSISCAAKKGDPNVAFVGIRRE